MTKELDYIIEKYKPDISVRRMPISLPLTRDELAELFAELEYKKGAEIGVAKGGYSEILCKANPDMELFSIDSWVRYKDSEFRGTRRPARLYLEAKERLEPYNCTIIKAFSMDAVQDFEPNSLDFVYIDGGHDFKNVACDIWEWSQVVRPGGIVSGHDFKRSTRGRGYIMHVKDVVQAYAYALKIRPWFSIHGDRIPGWFWVKE